MATYDTTEVESIEPRTIRACEEPMVVVPDGDGTGLFNVWTGTCDEDEGQPYVVDLAGAHDRCTCPDVKHNLSPEDGERCKHVRRVRLEFGLPPFGDVPEIRSEHSAPMDVELARRRRGIDVEPEPEPEPVTVEEQAAEAVRAMADGGTEQLPPITKHVEPPEQGGAAFIRCEGCSREVIGTDERRLPHGDDCPERAKRARGERFFFNRREPPLVGPESGRS
jgi:hypothetical protein